MRTKFEIMETRLNKVALHLGRPLKLVQAGPTYGIFEDTTIVYSSTDYDKMSTFIEGMNTALLLASSSKKMIARHV